MSNSRTSNVIYVIDDDTVTERQRNQPTNSTTSHASSRVYTNTPYDRYSNTSGRYNTEPIPGVTIPPIPPIPIRSDTTTTLNRTTNQSTDNPQLGTKDCPICL